MTVSASKSSPSTMAATTKAPCAARLEAAFDEFIRHRRACPTRGGRAHGGRGYRHPGQSQRLFRRACGWAFSRGGRRRSRSIIWAFPARWARDYIDYILADAHRDPGGEQRFYTEKVVTLPDSYQINDSRRAIAAGPRRAAPACRRRLCLLQFQLELQDHARNFALWMRLLQQVPDSVLWLLETNPCSPTISRPKRGARASIRARLIFAPPLPAGRASGAARAGRSVSGQPALQCPHHRQRCAVGGAAAAHLPGHSLSRAASPPACSRRSGLPELVTENWMSMKRWR